MTENCIEETVECFAYLVEEENIDRLQTEYNLFKNHLNEEDIILANLIEKKVTEIHTEQTSLAQVKLKDEIALKEFTNKIVMDKINSAYINVLKDEYNKKISIICNESKQNQKNIAKKIHSDYEIKINEFKSTIKQMETELDSQKSLWRNKIENLETEWTTKFKKLKEEKNEEITRHLKKSIDLIDENELLENQLEKLYLVIEQKSEQINAFEEQIYSYQTEIKKLQIQQFDGKDFLEYQLRFKAYNTQEKAVECLILSNKLDCSYHADESTVCNEEVNEILKNDGKNLEGPAADKALHRNNQKSGWLRNRDEDGLLNQSNANHNNDDDGHREDEERMSNQRNLKGKLIDSKQDRKQLLINNLKHVLNYMQSNDLTKITMSSSNKVKRQTLNELLKNSSTDIESLNNLVMLFLNENSGPLGANIDNLMYTTIPNSNSDFSCDDFENEDPTLNLSVNPKLDSENYKRQILSTITKSISINNSIEEYISQKISQLASNQEQHLNSLSSSSFSLSTADSSAKNKKNSIAESVSSESHRSLSIGESGRGISPSDIENDELLSELQNCSEPFLENLIETNLKVQKSVRKVFTLLDEANKELLDSQYKQSLLSKQVEEHEKTLKLIQSKSSESIRVASQQDELISRINNLEGLVAAYEIDIQSKNLALQQAGQELEATKAELNELGHYKETSQREIENLQSNNKDLREQHELLIHNIDDDKVNEVLQTNGILLEEKHQLIYKLKKETEMSNFQIKELEEIIEKLNSEIKCVKDSYEEQLFDFKKQTESMESQIRSEKEFINAQLSEREQERDEYETKIKELSSMIDMKSVNKSAEYEDNSFLSKIQDLELKNKELEILLQEKMDKLNKLSIVNDELERTLNEKDFQFGNNAQNEASSEEAISQYKNEINSLLINNKKQNETLDFLKEKLSDKEGLSLELTTQNESFLAKNRALTEERDLIQSELYSYMSRFSDLQIHRENSDAEFAEYKTKVEEKIHSLTFQIREKDTQLEEYKLRCSEMNENLESRLEVELSQSKLDYDKYVSDNEKLRKEISVLETNVITLKNNLHNKEKEFELERENLDKLSQNLLESKNEEIEDLSNLIDSIKASKEQNEKVVNELKESQTELSQVINQHISTIDSNENQIRGLRLENGDLLEKLAAKELETVSKKEYEELKQRHDEFEESHKVEKELLDELEEKLRNLDEQFILRTEHQSVVDSLTCDYETRLKMLSKENLSSEESISPDISFSNELGKKLIDEIKLNKILDTELAEEINNKEGKSSEVPENIKEIERMASENISELTITDLLEYKSYYGFRSGSSCSSVRSGKEVNQENFLRIRLLEEEKNVLAEEMFNLKNLLATLKTNGTGDKHLNIINEIFTKENDLLLNDLKKYVVHNSTNESGNYDQLVEMDTSIKQQIQYQKEFLDKYLTIGSHLSEKLITYKSKLEAAEEDRDKEANQKNQLKEELSENVAKVSRLTEKVVEEQELNFKLQKKINSIEDDLVVCKEQLETTTKETEMLSRENLSLKNSVNSLKKSLSQTYELQELYTEEQAKNDKLQAILNEMKFKERSQSNSLYQNAINLERLRQALEHTALKVKFLFDATDYSNQHRQNLSSGLNTVIHEIESLAEKINLNLLNPDRVNSGNNIYEKKILDQNRDLLATVKKLNVEKCQREEELKQYKMRRNGTSTLTDHDKEKFKKLYLKYLRAESFRKSLVYQKRFLIIMLSGYEETEREILATLKFESGLYNNHSNQSASSHSSSNGSPNNSSYAIKSKQQLNSHQMQRTHSTEMQQLRNNTCSIYSSRFRIFKAKSRFRTAVISLIAISRIKFLVRKHSGILGKVDNFYRN